MQDKGDDLVRLKALSKGLERSAAITTLLSTGRARNFDIAQSSPHHMRTAHNVA